MVVISAVHSTKINHAINKVNSECLINETKKSLVMPRTKYVEFSQMENTKQNLWKAFGKWFQIQREISGKTQEQVAKASGLHVKTISRIETGDSGSKRETVIELAKAVNANLNQALEHAGFSVSGTIPDIVLEIGFEGFTSEQNKMIAMFMSFLKNSQQFDYFTVKYDDPNAIFSENQNKEIEVDTKQNIPIHAQHVGSGDKKKKK